MEDSKIIGLLFERSEKALDEIERKYSSLVRKISVNITGNESDFPEIMNEVLLGVWNAIPPELPESLPAYIGKIARNQSLKKYRADRKSVNSLPIDDIAELIPDAETPSDDNEISDMIQFFIGTLSARNRSIFIRRYWMLQPVKDISRDLKMNQITVSTRLFRMKEKLRDLCTERGISL